MPSKNFDRIFNAATELFSRHGYHGTSTKAISVEAGVLEPEIYRLFLNKQKLFLDCLTAALGQSLEPAQLLMILSGEEREAVFPVLLGQAIRRWYSSLSAQSARLLMQAALSDNKSWSKLAYSRIDKTIGILARKIEKELHLPKASAIAAANSLILALFQYKISRPMLTISEKEREAVGNMIDQWVQGLSVRSK